MNTFAGLFLGLVGPMLSRALVYLGITAVTISGVNGLMAALLALTTDRLSGMPSAFLQLATLAGVPQALGMVWGAINARIAVWVALSSTKWVTK